MFHVSRSSLLKIHALKTIPAFFCVITFTTAQNSLCTNQVPECRISLNKYSRMVYSSFLTDGYDGTLHFITSLIQRLDWKDLALITDDNFMRATFLEHIGSSVAIQTEDYVVDPHGSKHHWDWSSRSWSRIQSSNILVLGSPFLQRKILNEFFNIARSLGRLSRLVIEAHWLLMMDKHVIDDPTVATLPVSNVAFVMKCQEHILCLQTLLWTSVGRETADVVVDLNRCHSSVLAAQLYPNVKNGLNGISLRAGVAPWFSSLILNKVNGSTEFSGFCMDLLNSLSSHLNFSYTMELSVDGQFGDFLDGNWTGLIGMLYRKELDLGLLLSPRPNRQEVVDWTMPVYYNHFTVVYKLSGDRQNAWTSFLRPFHWKVYMFLLGIFIFCVCLCVCLFSAQNRLLKSSSRSPSQVMEDLFASMLNRALPAKYKGGPTRAFFAGWCFFGLVMTTAYTCKLTSYLVDVSVPPPFTTLSGMVAQDQYKWGTVGGTAYLADFRDINTSVNRAVYRGIMDFAKDDPSVLDSSTETHEHKVLAGHYAFMGDSMGINEWASQNCDLFVFPKPIRSVDSNCIFTQKNSSVTRMMNKALRWFEDTGVLSHLRKKWFPDSPAYCLGSRNSSPKPINLEQLQGPLYLAGGGLLLASVLVAIECGIKRKHLNRSWRNVK